MSVITKSAYAKSRMALATAVENHCFLTLQMYATLLEKSGYLTDKQITESLSEFREALTYFNESIQDTDSE